MIHRKLLHMFNKSILNIFKSFAMPYIPVTYDCILYGFYYICRSTYPYESSITIHHRAAVAGILAQFAFLWTYNSYVKASPQNAL